MHIPNDKRKEYPVFEGFIRYFPDAIMAVAHQSWKANEKHNPGQPLHWDRTKSTDEKDAEIRHMIDIAKGQIVDDNGLNTYVAKAWRAMADLQKHLEGQYYEGTHLVTNYAKEQVEAFNKFAKEIKIDTEGKIYKNGFDRQISDLN